MILEDDIYGKFEVDLVLKEIVNSKPLQRLKSISQFGLPSTYYHLGEEQCYSRFEHSVGVMLLLRKLGASIEEQIAGLIHDVSHTAFSHLIDWVKGSNVREDYHDKRHRSYVFGTKILKILKSLNLNVNEIVDERNHSLLEQKIPGLCADRIDYLLREIPVEEARQLADNLTVVDDQIVFMDEESAFEFANLFLEKQMDHWGGYEAVVRYSLFAEILKKALDEGIITFDDFWGVDNLITERLEKYGSNEIKQLLDILKKDSLANLPRGTKRKIKKFRYVIPEFLSENNLKSIGEDSDFKFRLEQARMTNKRGIILPELEPFYQRA